jgi:hypothetical protein
MATILQDTASSGAAQKTIATAINSAVNANTSAWNTSQDVTFTAPGQTATLPAIGASDFGKSITLRNAGTNSFVVALTGGSINSAIGLTMNPGSIWTFEAQSTTVANLVYTNASQSAIAEQGEVLTIQDGFPVSVTIADVTGSSFTLNGQGTFQINVELVYQVSAAANDLIAELYTAANALIPNSKIRILDANPGYAGNGSLTITINQASTTSYKLRARTGGGTGSIYNGGLGNSKISWFKTSGQVALTAVPTTPQGFAHIDIGTPSVTAVSVIPNVGFVQKAGNLGLSSGWPILKAGKTYIIEASLSVGNYGAANANFPVAVFDICSGITTVALPSGVTGRAVQLNLNSVPAIGGGVGEGSRPAYAIFTPSVDTIVNLTMRQFTNVGGTALSGVAAVLSGSFIVTEIGMQGIVVASVSPVVVNGASSNVPGLYDVAMSRWSGNFEFYEDAFLRMDHNAGLLRFAAVGTAKNLGVYGMDSSSAANMDATSAGAFPIGTASPSANSLWKASFGNIAVGVFTAVSAMAIGADYDDIQLYWIEMAEAGVKYRITIMGGNSVGAIVERWNTDRLTLNTKTTLPN